MTISKSDVFLNPSIKNIKLHWTSGWSCRFKHTRTHVYTHTTSTCGGTKDGSQCDKQELKTVIYTQGASHTKSKHTHTHTRTSTEQLWSIPSHFCNGGVVKKKLRELLSVSGIGRRPPGNMVRSISEGLHCTPTRTHTRTVYISNRVWGALV